MEVNTRYFCPRCGLAHIDVIDKSTEERMEFECWGCGCRYTVRIVETPISQSEKELKREGLNSKGEKKRGTNISEAIIKYLLSTEQPTREEGIMKAIKGRNGIKRKVLRDLVRSGRVQRTGKGTKIDAFKYTCSHSQ